MKKSTSKQKNNIDKLPQIGKTYNHFDDGKIRRSRL
jgi:hypothetical protein